MRRSSHISYRHRRHQQHRRAALAPPLSPKELNRHISVRAAARRHETKGGPHVPRRRHSPTLFGAILGVAIGMDFSWAAV